jgi:hypothetical protein
MFTLQVLDRGQTFLRPLESRPVVIGHAIDADLRLEEAGVAEHHARIDPDDEAPTLLALGTERVLVNGRAVQQCTLQLGDRIEVGRAVLVVGRTVSRRATPEDVLAEDRTVARDLPVRRRGRGARRRVQRACWLILSAGLAAAAAILGLPYFTPSNTPAPVERLAELRQAGRFSDARAELERLHAWAGADPGRAAFLQHEIDLVDAVEQAVFLRRQKVLVDAQTWSQADLEQHLQSDEHYGDVAEREAARIVRVDLPALLASLPQRSAPATANGQPAVADAAPPPARRIDAAGLVEESQRLSRDGLHAQAIDLLRNALDQAEPAQAVALQSALDVARDRAHTAMTAALEQAVSVRQAQGAPAALAQLEAEARQLPMGGEFAALPRTITELREAASAVARVSVPAPSPAVAAAGGDSVRRATLADLRELLEKVRVAESAGDFGSVIGVLDQGAQLVEARDPQFAARLTAKARDFTLLSELQVATGASLAAGRRCSVRLRSGEAVDLEGVDGPRLLAAGGRQVSWLDFDAAALNVLLREAKLGPRATLGAAVLAYRNGEPEAAETMLAQALRADGKLKEPIDGVIARGRGENAPSGYVLEKDAFVAATKVAARQTALKLQARIRTAMQDRKSRDQLVEQLLAQGPPGLEPMVLAFQRELASAVGRVQAMSLHKQFDKLAEQRQALDQARRYALDLIYDEEKYFYPYKPPAVSGERFAEYNRVQAEVDRRVAALRTLWQDDRHKMQVPASLGDDLERIDWLAQVLRDLGELEPAAVAALDWARSLPPGEKVTLQNFCLTPAERVEQESWRRIEDLDRKAIAALNMGEREEFILTNEYRRMYRHRPLALSPKLHNAAREHATEMSKLGYFSHFSPVAGRKTPYDRMKLCGYAFGCSENIALNGAAAGAHDAWLHSSGHHRNLLSPSHTEFGIGNDGRNWVQDFGQGTDYESELPRGR